MKTIQMTLDIDLVDEVDTIVKELKTTTSAFTRTALRNEIKSIQIQQLESKHRKGYEMNPGKKEEFNIWEDEQDWGDE